MIFGGKRKRCSLDNSQTRVISVCGSNRGMENISKDTYPLNFLKSKSKAVEKCFQICKILLLYNKSILVLMVLVLVQTWKCWQNGFIKEKNACFVLDIKPVIDSVAVLIKVSSEDQNEDKVIKTLEDEQILQNLRDVGFWRFFLKKVIHLILCSDTWKVMLISAIRYKPWFWNHIFGIRF